MKSRELSCTGPRDHLELTRFAQTKEITHIGEKRSFIEIEAINLTTPQISSPPRCRQTFIISIMGAPTKPSSKQDLETSTHGSSSRTPPLASSEADEACPGRDANPQEMHCVLLLVATPRASPRGRQTPGQMPRRRIGMARYAGIFAEMLSPRNSRRDRAATGKVH